jgi:hypothetical protein
MANVQERLPQNVPGDFFVDSTCIDCETSLVITWRGQSPGRR